MAGCQEGWPWEKLQNTTGICRNSDGFGSWICAPGWQRTSPGGDPAGCSKVPEDEFAQVVDGTLAFANLHGKVLCAARSEHEGKHGAPLVLAKCRPGYMRQRLARICLHSETSQNGAKVFAKFCQQEEPLPPRGATLFCFMGVLPDSSEVALQEVAQSRGAGIFACEASKVHASRPAGTFDTPDGAFSANTAVFVQIWEEVFADEIYKDYDWTVKVDPDTVWVPQRLRERLGNFWVNIYEAVFVKNTAIVDFGFLGPIEIMSQPAILKLAEMSLSTECPAGDYGEDGWLCDCMENHAGIAARVDTNILYSGTQIDACGDATYVAYHYYKDPGSWGSCLDATR